MKKKLFGIFAAGLLLVFGVSAFASTINFSPSPTSYVNFLSAPSKRLKASITGSATSFQLGDIKGWDGNNLTSADLGGDAYAVFRNDTNTAFEIMQIDPNSIASTSISIINRGMSFNGDIAATSSAKMLTWIKNTTIVELGTDVPQILGHMVQIGGAQTIAGVKTFTATPGSTGGSPVNATDLVIKSYVDGQLAAGVADGNYTTFGGFILATTTQLKAGTQTSTATRYLVVPSFAVNQSSTANKIPIADVNGHIDGAYINSSTISVTSLTSVSTTLNGTTTFPTTATVALNGSTTASGTFAFAVTPIQTARINSQMFVTTTTNATSSSFFTWTVPSGVTKVLVTMVGGGGGGSAGHSGTNTGGGGGPGGTCISYPTSTTPGTNISVTVGGGGPAGIAVDAAGVNASSSIFGGITAGNGTGGGTASAGQGAAGSTGTNCGGFSPAVAAVAGSTGTGGSTLWGTGGAGTGSPGGNGTGFGSGGGGGNVGQSGGQGMPGFVFIQW